MVTRLFLVYLLVEVAALVALVSTIGFGWTLLVLLATFAAGLVLAGSQVRRQLTRLRSGPGTGRDTVTDNALVALGTVLVVVPGLVTTAAGLLLLWPVTRAAARPLLTALAVGGLRWRAPVIGAAAFGAQRYATARRDDVVEGEVIDVTYEEPPVTPTRPTP